MQPDLQATSSLDEWLSYLEHSHFKAIDLGLERVKTVAQSLDLLQPAPVVITVGGTNGKGTTCRLLEMILLNGGYRVGVYSSPHLLHYNERVRIQNQPLPDCTHTESFAFIHKHSTQSLTYFEFSTLSALHLFKQAALDVVILEVGLGGRLDATNIVDSDIAVITSIDIDHTEFLGATREQIGFEKAGIFRAGKPVIIGEPDVPLSMLNYAEQLNCPVFRRNHDWNFSVQTDNWTWQRSAQNGSKVRSENLPFCRIPLANAATALAAVQQLPFSLSPQTVYRALQEVELTGRFQRLKSEQLQHLAKLTQRSPGSLPQIILDVGHNPHAARYLSEQLSALKAGISGKIIALCGILKDKDTQGVLAPLLPLIDRWYCVSLTGLRGQSGHELYTILLQTAQQQAVSVEAEYVDSIMDGIQRALKQSTEHDVIVVFGSFHTVSGLLACLN